MGQKGLAEILQHSLPFSLYKFYVVADGRLEVCVHCSQSFYLLCWALGEAQAHLVLFFLFSYYTQHTALQVQRLHCPLCYSPVEIGSTFSYWCGSFCFFLLIHITGKKTHNFMAHKLLILSNFILSGPWKTLNTSERLWDRCLYISLGMENKRCSNLVKCTYPGTLPASMGEVFHCVNSLKMQTLHLSSRDVWKGSIMAVTSTTLKTCASPVTDIKLVSKQ